MSYKDTTTKELRTKFGVQFKANYLFKEAKEVQPSAFLQTSLAKADEIMLTTEKAKSERIVAPILAELREINKQIFNIFSGEYLDGDKANGLYGECDFLISKNTHTYDMEAPVFTLVEAKKGDLEQATAQCMAQMLGAYYFNAKENITIPAIYGCVTNAIEWRFIQFQNNIFTMDRDFYTTNNLAKLLGVFQIIIDNCKPYL